MIRPATPGDLAAIAVVESAVYQPVVYPTFFFRQAIDLWPGMLLVADLDGGVAGYVLCAPSATPGEAWVLSAAVRPERRGQGIGRALMEGALAALASYRIVRLTVGPDNAAAVGLYLRLGFVTDRVSEDHFGPGEPRLLMSRRG